MEPNQAPPEPFSLTEHKTWYSPVFPFGVTCTEVSCDAAHLRVFFAGGVSYLLLISIGEHFRFISADGSAVHELRFVETNGSRVEFTITTHSDPKLVQRVSKQPEGTATLIETDSE